MWEIQKVYDVVECRGKDKNKMTTQNTNIIELRFWNKW